jgi:hypothetical protein
VPAAVVPELTPVDAERAVEESHAAAPLEGLGIGAGIGID